LFPASIHLSLQTLDNHIFPFIQAPRWRIPPCTHPSTVFYLLRGEHNPCMVGTHSSGPQSLHPLLCVCVSGHPEPC
jgi:hypothetical protein